MVKEITLTKEELEDVKDDVRFRERVLLHLKLLAGIPDRVTKVETKIVVLMWGAPILLGGAALVWKVFM